MGDSCKLQAPLYRHVLSCSLLPITAGCQVGDMLEIQLPSQLDVFVGSSFLHSLTTCHYLLSEGLVFIPMKWILEGGQAFKETKESTWFSPPFGDLLPSQPPTQIVGEKWLRVSPHPMNPHPCLSALGMNPAEQS